MSAPQIRFSNNREIIEALSDYFNQTSTMKGMFTIRPFNHYAPDFTTWWLAKGKEWPAFKRGKLSIQVSPLSNREAGLLYASVYAEKGFGAKVASLAGTPKKYIMRDDWHWNSFVKYGQSARVDDITQQICLISDSPVRVYIAIYESNKFPDYDNLQYPDVYDKVTFTVQPQNQKLHIDEQAVQELHILNHCINVQEITSSLSRWDKADFFWVDFHIGIELRYHHDNISKSWDVSDIWDKSLSPWLEILK